MDSPGESFTGKVLQQRHSSLKPPFCNIAPRGNHTPYQQIERGPLCFKIEVKSAVDHRKILDSWLARLNTAGERMGMPQLVKRRRFRAGTSMTVATWDDWLVRTADGLLDYTSSLQNLRLAENLVNAALSQP